MDASPEPRWRLIDVRTSKQVIFEVRTSILAFADVLKESSGRRKSWEVVMRPTAKDLAEAAGVSLATVDRVLNERPNVSLKAARLVNDAIERIGFVRNPAAVSLARNKVYRFLFLLPASGDLYLKELLRHVEELTDALKGDLTEIAYRQIGIDDAHGVARLLSSLDKEEVDGVAVMAPESPQVRDAMARLLQRNIKVVQFLSGQEKLPEADFVGIDNFAAGASAGKLMGMLAGSHPGKVMVIAETMQSLDSIQRRLASTT